MNLPSFRAGLSLAFALSLSAPALLLSSCSQGEQREAAADTDLAYQSFKAHVEDVERNVQNVDLSDTEFSEQMNRAKADYDAKLAAVERDADQLTAEQRADVETLKTRYSTSFALRESAYKSRVPGTLPTGESAAGARLYESAAAGYAALPAASLRATYEQFVRNVKANESRYGIEDWRTVNDDWRALNDRKDQIEDQLSLADRTEIAKEKVKYAAFKTFDKSEARAEQGADATKSGAYKAGQAIGRGANKVGKVIDRGADKAGAAAKEVYKGVRDASKDEDKVR